jgi:hypothetical protein
MRQFILTFVALAPLMTGVGVDFAAAQATSSVKCGDGSVVTVSTGTDKGNCKKTPDGRISCVDTGGGGSLAIGGCKNGKPDCGTTTNAGSCEIKMGSRKKTPKGTSVPGIESGVTGDMAPAQ